MRSLSIVVLMASMILVGQSCTKKKGRKTSSVNKSIYDTQTYYDIEQLVNYQNSIEEILVWRHTAIDFINDLEKTKILKSNQLVKIHEEGTETYQSFRDKVWPHVEHTKWIADKHNVFLITLDSETKILKKRKKVRRPGGNKKNDQHNIRYITYKEIHINPQDTHGKEIIYDIKMAMATALVMYDNYMIVLEQLQNMKKIRHLINYDNEELKNTLAKITHSFNKYDNFNRVSVALRFHKELKEYNKEFGIKPDKAIEYFDAVIESSQSFTKLNKEFKRSLFGRKIVQFYRYITDYFKEGKNNTLHVVSKGFGNSVGLIQTRRGKMHKWSDEKLTQIEERLEPLDVLMEKTPFRLTDKFIPGHWGHVAIWTGNKKQLQDIGLWEHPTIKPFQEDIEKGKRIIEALRPGVQFNTLRHFVDIDDFAAVRLKEQEKKDPNYLINAFKQVGKTYDFNFDVETDEKIVCSELAYVTFDDMDWPTSKAAGRYTISPDNVGEKVGPEQDFETIVLIHDGKEVFENLDEAFSKLMKDSKL